MSSSSGAITWKVNKGDDTDEDADSLDLILDKDATVAKKQTIYIRGLGLLKILTSIKQSRIF